MSEIKISQLVPWTADQPDLIEYVDVSTNTSKKCTKEDFLKLIITDKMTFNTSANESVTELQVGWNDNCWTFNTWLKGWNVTLRNGKQLVERVRNTSWWTMGILKVVKITWSIWGTNLTADFANSSSEGTSASTFWITAEEIGSNQSGFITLLGLIPNVDTSAFAEWAALWLDSVDWGITDEKPDTPNHLVFLGWCINSNPTIWIIYAKIQNGYEIDELHDVLITNKAEWDTLVWNNTLSYWENKAIMEVIWDWVVIDSQYLPSYVDDILEFADFASLPTPWESGKIYVTLDDNKQFRWGGTEYVNTPTITNAEVKQKYEANSDTNAFTDIEKNKLWAISWTNTWDETNGSVKTKYEANADTNVFTDNEKNKLGAISWTNTWDETNGSVKTKYEANADTNAFTDAEKNKLWSVIPLAKVPVGWTIWQQLAKIDWTDYNTEWVDPWVPSSITWIPWADKITNIVSLTQAEYDAIATPSVSTLYIITD